MFMHNIFLLISETLLLHVKPLRPPVIDQILRRKQKLFQMPLGNNISVEKILVSLWEVLLPKLTITLDYIIEIVNEHQHREDLIQMIIYVS